MTETAGLKELHDRLKAREWEQAKAICRTMFGCTDVPLDVLSKCLSPGGFYSLCAYLERIRDAPDEAGRIAIMLFVEQVIDLDLPTADQKRRASEAVRAIVSGLPVVP